jgi:hypothetical protein
MKIQTASTIYKPTAKKVKFVLFVYARKAYRGNGGRAALILNLSTRRGE